MQQITIYTLMVMFFCYLPHVFMLPWYWSIWIFSLLGYRLVVGVYAFPLPKKWFVFILFFISLVYLFAYFRQILPGTFYIGLLITCIALKSLEAKDKRDMYILVLCNFYIILAALLLYQDLWIFIYMLIALLANISILIKLTSPNIAFSKIKWPLLRSVFFIILPFSILLFYLFPRLPYPLWSVPNANQNQIGFSDEMKPGNISELFQNENIAMQVIFKENYKFNLYWRGVILSEFDGLSWTQERDDYDQLFYLLPLIEEKQADYEILLEPHQKKWLFYQNNPGTSKPELLFSPNIGLMQANNSNVYKRFSYQIIEQPILYQPLTTQAIEKNTTLPLHGNPRLRAWAKQKFAEQNSQIPAFIEYLQHYINKEPYNYTLIPGKVETRANLLDYFWFESKQGYCEYYTATVVIILRSVGIPARIISGFYGGQWNGLGRYLTIRNKDAHAWLEYWQDGLGWQRFDPVSFIAPERIDKKIRQSREENFINDWINNKEQEQAWIPWNIQIKWALDSTRFFLQRWIVFYNQNSQNTLLERFGLGHWGSTQLLRVSIGLFLLFILITIIWYFLLERRQRNALQLAYYQLQKEMNHFGINTRPPTTLYSQLKTLELQLPRLKSLLQEYYQIYETMRLRSRSINLLEQRKIQKLFQSLRKKLRIVRLARVLKLPLGK